MKKTFIIALSLTCALALSAAPGGRGENTRGAGARTNNVVRGTPRTNTPAARASQPSTGRYTIENANLTKFTTNLIFFKYGGNGSEYTLRYNQATKVLTETSEVEKVPGKEGQTRFKTVEGKLTDLKIGQRLKLSHTTGMLSEITILQPKADKQEKSAKEEKKENPAAK